MLGPSYFHIMSEEEVTVSGAFTGFGHEVIVPGSGGVYTVLADVTCFCDPDVARSSSRAPMGRFSHGRFREPISMTGLGCLRGARTGQNGRSRPAWAASGLRRRLRWPEMTRS